MKSHFAVEWAYKSSPNADRAGLSKEGCWVVEHYSYEVTPLETASRIVPVAFVRGVANKAIADALCDGFAQGVIAIPTPKNSVPTKFNT